MNELLAKISSYNIFNYLFPGAVFCIFLAKAEIVSYPSDAIDRLIWFYFFGLIVSRLGSLILEPALYRVGFLHEGDYLRFLLASKEDLKLEVMVEVANTYRTISCACICFAAAVAAKSIQAGATNTRSILALMGLFGFVLFTASFKKQHLYVSKRVNSLRG